MLDSVVLPNGGSGSTPMWTSALNVQRGGYVVSPADGEIYRRIAATGASGTDPADDTANYVAASYERVLSIPPFWIFNSTSTGGLLKGGTRVAAGSTVAQGSRTLALTATGRGELSHLSMQIAYSLESNSGGRIEIIADGRSVYNTDVYGYNSNYFSILGSVSARFFNNATDYIAVEASKPIQFRRSLQIYFTPTWTTWSSQNGITYMVRAVA